MGAGGQAVAPRALAASCVALLVLSGCAPPQADDGVGDHQEAVVSSSCVLTTYKGLNIYKRTCSDGVHFYTSDGNHYSSSGVYTGYEWQCVEWLNRFFHFYWGTHLPWYGNATDKCSSHPSSVSRVSTPWKGDGVVFSPGACLERSSTGSCIMRADATYGHVGIVAGFPSSSTLRIKDENGSQHAHNDYLRSAVQCYLRDSHHKCDAGATRDCMTADGCAGSQTCASDGRSWGACMGSCPAPDAGTAPPTPDAGMSEPDASMPAPDAGAPAPDAGAPPMQVDTDAGTYEPPPDAAVSPGPPSSAPAGYSPRPHALEGGCSAGGGGAGAGWSWLLVLWVVDVRRRRKKAGG